MIYVTGDLHGDSSRFKSRGFRRIRRGDTLIICGDFGFLWNDYKEEQKLLRWIGKRKYNVLFVDGVHDNLHSIGNYPETTWNGGAVRVISGRLRYACRGSVFTIDGQKIFTFGGGEPVEIQEESYTNRWCELQLPTLEEIETARENLTAENNKVDYIVSHQCSRKTKKLLTMEDSEANVLDTFFDELRETCEYGGWLFGNYHIDKVIPPKEMIVFMRVIPLLATFRESIAKRK